MTADLALQHALKTLLFRHCSLAVYLPDEIHCALPIKYDLIGIGRAQTLRVLGRPAEVLLDVNIWTVVDNLAAAKAVGLPAVLALQAVRGLTFENWRASNLSLRSTRYVCERLGNRSVAHGTIALSAALTKTSYKSIFPTRLIEVA